MKNFVPNQLIKHERDQYQPNNPYELEDELAFYFRSNGWGDIVDSEFPAAQPQGDVTLDIHNAKVQPKDHFNG